MEMHLFRRAAVHPAFGLGEPPEDASRRLLHRVRERCGVDDFQDVLQTPVMGMDFIEDNADVRRIDVSGDLPADLDFVSTDAEAGELIPEPLGVRPCADERPERHVAADSRKAVEIGNLHRFTICAKYPAPKPLSIFMTATPAAHEFNIASSAASPPKLAP